MSRLRALALSAALLSVLSGCCLSNPYASYNNPCCQQPQQCCNYAAGSGYYESAGASARQPTVAETQTAPRRAATTR